MPQCLRSISRDNAMRKLIVCFTFVLFFTFQLSASENGFPAPKCSFNCGNQTTASPWSFEEDFETDSWRTRFKPDNIKGAKVQPGWKAFRTEKESNNTYLVVRVEDGWNETVGGSKQRTERSELELPRKKLFGKEVWYSFDVKLPSNFSIINDRQLFTQVKVGNDKYKHTPIFALHYRGQEVRNGKNKLDVFKAPCGKKSGTDLRVSSLPVQSKKRNSNRIKCNARIIEPLPNKVLGPQKNDMIFAPGVEKQWTKWIIGMRVTNKSDGFIKVLQNQEMMYSYEGPTFGFKKLDPSSTIRIGMYRDGGQFGEVYPAQELYFDNFKVGSTLESVK